MSEPNWQERLIRRVAEDQTGDDPAAGHAAAPSPDPPPPQPHHPAPPRSQQTPPPSGPAGSPSAGPAPQPAPAWQQPPTPPPQYQQPPPPPRQQPYPQAPPYQQQQPPYQQQQAPYEQQAPYGDGGEDRGLLRRLGRIASEAAYLAGGSSRMQRDLDNIGIIRRPIAITRTMGVVSPVRESGASIVAALITDVLGAQRSDRVVAIDADPHQAELSRRLELAVGSAGGSRVRLVRCDPTPEAVREAVGKVAGGSHGVGAAVIDCPAGLTTPVTTHVANTSHGLVVSMPSVRQVAEYCLGELDRLGVAAQQLLVAKGVVVVNLVDSADQDSVGWLVTWLQDRGVTTVVMPYDEHLAQAWPLRPDHLRPATRRAVLELTARTVERTLGETPGNPD